MVNKMVVVERAIHGLSRALWDSDLVATRVSLAIGEFVWAIMLLWPGDTFQRPTYQVMAQITDEDVWGIVLFLTAVVQISIVLSETYHNYFSRMFAAWNALLWGFLVVSMLMSVYPPPAAIGGEIALALAAMWVWVRPFVLREGFLRAYGSICAK